MKTLYRLVSGSMIGAALALALTLSEGALPAHAGGPLVYTVDDDGVQCPGAPYHDIMSALAAAKTADPGLTKEILVCPGTYPGLVVVSSMQNIQLVGQPGATIVPDAVPYYSSLLVVTNSSNVLVSGLRFDGRDSLPEEFHATGAIFFNESDGKIDRNFITGWRQGFGNTSSNDIPTASIYINDGQGQLVTISNNTIEDFMDFGILVMHQAQATILNNTINTAPLPYHSPSGIGVIGNTAGMGIFRNAITSVLSTEERFNADDGIYLLDSSDVNISNNAISHWYSGIHLDAQCQFFPNTDNNNATSNTISEVWTGIWVTVTPNTCAAHADNNVFTGNSIVDTSASGRVGVEIAANEPAGPPAATALNLLVTGNTITHFSFAVFDDHHGGTVTGTFAPNTYTP